MADMSVDRPHRPTELQILLLQAALLEGDAMRAAWERARERLGDVERLDYPSFRLLPQLYRNLLDAGVDDPLMETLRAVYEKAWFSNQRLFHEAAGVIRLLENAGVETIVLKGAALATEYYRDPGARPMEDLDVFVRGFQAARAAQVLASAGWRRHPEGVPLDYMMRVTHSTEFVDPRGRFIDLHWSRSWEPLPDAGVWERAVPITIAGAPTRALDPTDALVQICLHGLSWPPAPVRWIADAVMVTRAAGDRIDWERLGADAERWRITAKLETSLRFLRDTFDVAVPEPTVEWLRRARRPLHERAAHAAVTSRMPVAVNSILIWDRYRRLRRSGTQVGSGFAGFWRESTYAPDWRSVVGRYVSAVRDLARHRALDHG